ncbi:tetratricopeptide repeat protein [Streptomyces sp. A7024]|uniref:Tetratricopeptide repeat protein n=1 Tax=Streptomyces coryli TaxID=1128680 RepID=A0A6G4TVK0_9ACTN|nr:AAA family ATPase [Streptomyces coryli]NGN63067.1 tetratricopeptide repeat protein [Streptomyces coryli]
MRRTSRSGGSPARPPTTGNLPAELNRFIGRAGELADVEGQLAAARLVTVTGVGGVGKSRLALRVGAGLQDRFADGVWLIELSALRDGHLLWHTVAEALGVTGSGSPQAALERHLADRNALLILDSCEHLVAESARLVSTLLKRCAGLRVLATSRRSLDVEGEQLFPLAPLPAEIAAGPEAGPVSDAVALFTERAAAVQRGFPGDGVRAADIAELCRRLDGIPLALELAASRLRVLSVEQILHRLDDRFRLLTGGSRSALPRHQTLRTAIGWSHELCSPEERLLWSRLSVFAGDFDLDAVEYLCSGDGLHADDVLTVLTELVDQSIVVREESGGRVRYRMLDTVRDYGAQWLREMDDADALRRRHRDWYLGLATWCELDWFGPRQLEVARRIEDELPNVRLALEYCLESPEEAHVGQYLAATLWFYWICCGRLSEGRMWLDRALALDGGQPEPRCKALWVAGHAAVGGGDPVAALGLLHEAERLAESCGDEVALAHTQQILGATALITDDIARGVRLLRSAVERFHAMGELNAMVLLAQVQLGQALAFAGDGEAAVALLQEADEIAQDSGEQWARSYALYVWAHTLWRMGDPGKARELALRALAIKHGFRDVVGMTIVLDLLAPLTAADAPEAAARLQGSAEAGWRSFGAERFGSRHFSEPYEAGAGDARKALGDSRYEAAVAEGRGLGLTAAVSGVLAGSSVPTQPCCGPRPQDDLPQAPAPAGEVPQARRPGQRTL